MLTFELRLDIRGTASSVCGDVNSYFAIYSCITLFYNFLSCKHFVPDGPDTYRYILAIAFQVDKIINNTLFSDCLWKCLDLNLRTISRHVWCRWKASDSVI